MLSSSAAFRSSEKVAQFGAYDALLALPVPVRGKSSWIWATFGTLELPGHWRRDAPVSRAAHGLGTSRGEWSLTALGRLLFLPIEVKEG